MKVTNNSKVIAKRGNDCYLITNANLENGKYNSFEKAIVYDDRRKKIIGENTIGAIIGRGYWNECKNDSKIIEKVIKL